MSECSFLQFDIAKSGRRGAEMNGDSVNERSGPSAQATLKLEERVTMMPPRTSEQ